MKRLKTIAIYLTMALFVSCASFQKPIDPGNPDGPSLCELGCREACAKLCEGSEDPECAERCADACAFTCSLEKVEAQALAPTTLATLAAPGCHDFGRDMLVAIATGKPVPAVPEGCPSNLGVRSLGSENIPLMLAVGAIARGDQPETDLLPYLRDHGFVGEADSFLYGSWTAAAIELIYPRIKASEVRDAARTWLRARWTRLALGAVPTPPTRAIFQIAGGPDVDRPLDLRTYRGVWVNSPSPRSITETNVHGWWYEGQSLHGMFSAALGLEWTPRSAPRVDRTSWPLAVLRDAGLFGAGPERWGLTPGERAELRAFLENPGADAARRLLRWLKPFPNLPGVVTTWVHGSDGVAVAQSSTTNHVKAGQGHPLFVGVNRRTGVARILTPVPLDQADKRRAAGFFADTPDGLSVKAGGRYFVTVFGELDRGVDVAEVVGEERFRVIHDAQGWRVVEAGGEQPPPPPPPPPPVPPVTICGSPDFARYVASPTLGGLNAQLAELDELGWIAEGPLVELADGRLVSTIRCHPQEAFP